MSTRMERTLRDLVSRTPPSEMDLYPYIKDFFVHIFGYPKDHVLMGIPGDDGTPDVTLVSKDDVEWVVAEAKPEPGRFLKPENRRESWRGQLSRYISADTVHALLIDPTTLAVLRPNGLEVKVVSLDRTTAAGLTDSAAPESLGVLAYEDSVSEKALSEFKEGLSPARYLDVTTEEIRSRFYAALRLSTRELIDYSTQRQGALHSDHQQYEQEVAATNVKVQGAPQDQAYQTALARLREQHQESIAFVEKVLPGFEERIGRALPTDEEEAKRFLDEAYAAEGASLVLARALFVRFFEDHGMVKRKISNGGVKAFRDYTTHLQDDYRELFRIACKDSEVVYKRFFEPSFFDFAHGGDGSLSTILLRIFYRLNAFDFTKITGDVLGNLYERFLDPNKRKRIGEYYTPTPVAKYILGRIGFFKTPRHLLDPACGSGTFLIAALTGIIQQMRRRGIALDIALKQAIGLVHGLDINVFATFIAQMQLVWHLFPWLRQAKQQSMPEFKVYGGDNSLVYDQPQTLTEALLLKPNDKTGAVRGAQYGYVVGNPPYIRNERLKDRGSWRDFYHEADFKNSDVSFFFVARAVRGGLMSPKAARAAGVTPVRRQSWLEDGGRMCFVLPMGLCDSDAASVLRRELIGSFKVLEVTDLEEVAIQLFPSPQASGRATTAPVLLFIERNKAEEGHAVRIARASERAFESPGFITPELEVSHVPQTLFSPSPVNPFGQILTKLRGDDLPILRKVMSSPSRPLKEYVQEPTPTYGITVAGAGRLADKPEKGRLPLAKGLNISSFHVDPQVDSWVDITDVRSASIWGKEELTRQKAYAVSNIALSTQCASFDPSTLAFNDSAIVFVPQSEYQTFPWAILANSSVIRYVHLLCLRSGLIGVGTPVGGGRRASWLHVYPRVVAAFPVPSSLVENSGELPNLNRELEGLAERIAKRSQAVADAVTRANKKALSLFLLDFGHWQGDAERPMDIRLEREDGRWLLRPYMGKQATLMQLEGSYELLNVVKYLAEVEGGAITARGLQALQVPEDVTRISALIDNALDPESPDIREFKRLHSTADRILAKGFGLTDEETEYMWRRLSSPPLDVLQPRWPWTPVKRRAIQEYETDRFA